MKSKTKTENVARDRTTYGIFLIVGILSILSFTTLHDPIIHGGVAILNGWEVVDFDKGILTGFTTAEVALEEFERASIFQVWMYYMAPSLILFFLPAVVYIFNPQRLIALMATVLMFLNFASLSPERMLPGSDSSQALQFLLERGTDPVLANMFHWEIFGIVIMTFPLMANALHWIIFGMAIITFITMCWIWYENNPKDSKKRMADLKGGKIQ